MFKKILYHFIQNVSTAFRIIIRVTVATYDYSNNLEVPLDNILNDCKKGLAENNLCVVMIHPQEFLEAEKVDNEIRNIDEEKYNERFITLIDQLDELGAEFTTFKSNLYY